MNANGNGTRGGPQPIGNHLVRLLIAQTRHDRMAKITVEFIDCRLHLGASNPIAQTAIRHREIGLDQRHPGRCHLPPTQPVDADVARNRPQQRLLAPRRYVIVIQLLPISLSFALVNEI